MLKRFNVLVIFRIVLILANTILLSRIIGNPALFFNQLILSLFLIAQVLEMIHFVNQTNRALARLFLAIKHSDFTLSFKGLPLGKSFAELNDSFTEIIDAYKKVKIEKEGQFHLLQMLVTQIQIGIITIAENNLVLINPIAEKLLGIAGIKNLDLLRHLNPQVYAELEYIGLHGKKLWDTKVDGETKTLSIEVMTLTILGKPHKLITVQDINAAIEQKEIEAWHRLIRILTHEIMNSVTPISSLTETLQTMLSDKAGNLKSPAEITDETVADIRFSLDTIQKRSEGLLHFVDNYRKLSRIPKPVFQIVSVSILLAQLQHLMQGQLDQHRIKLAIEIQPATLSLHCDPNLIEQVIINLLTNSIHALHATTQKEIKILAYVLRQQTIIEIVDNGMGIPEKEIHDIFVPFFSTKKEGSGIGLSLSKQIMSLHGGAIKAISKSGLGTSFYLTFKMQSPTP